MTAVYDAAAVDRIRQSTAFLPCLCERDGEGHAVGRPCGVCLIAEALRTLQPFEAAEVPF